MSLAIGVVSNGKSMGFDEKGKEGAADVPETQHAGKTAHGEESGDERGTSLSRHMSEGSIAVTEDEEEDVERRIDLGPQCTLKEQLEKDKVGSYSHCFSYFSETSMLFVYSFHTTYMQF